MERLVSKIEVKYEKWDKTQRKEARKEYSALLKECEQKYDSFSESEKDQLNSLIGRYCGFMAKHGFDQAKDAVIRTGERLPKMAEGFKDGLEK